MACKRQMNNPLVANRDASQQGRSDRTVSTLNGLRKLRVDGVGFKRAEIDTLQHMVPGCHRPCSGFVDSFRSEAINASSWNSLGLNKDAGLASRVRLG